MTHFLRHPDVYRRKVEEFLAEKCGFASDAAPAAENEAGEGSGGGRAAMGTVGAWRGVLGRHVGMPRAPRVRSPSVTALCLLSASRC